MKEKVDCKEVAQRIWNNIVKSSMISEIQSWNIQAFEYGILDFKPVLWFYVKGLNHKGWVCVYESIQEDMYNIRLMSTGRKRQKAYLTNVQQFELGRVLNDLIEHNEDYSVRDYISKKREDLRNIKIDKQKA